MRIIKKMPNATALDSYEMENVLFKLLLFSLLENISDQSSILRTKMWNESFVVQREWRSYLQTLR